MTGRTTGTDELGDVLRSLASERCSGGWRPIDVGDVATLTIAEAAIVGRAVLRRRAEFASGRALLRGLIGADIELLRASNGAPVLPAGFVGSLAHDREIVIGVVAPAATVRAVGIDVEPVQELDPGVAELVVRPDDVVPDPLTAFVAKEAAYKAWSCLGGEMLEHHDVRVVVDDDLYRAELRGEMVVRGELGRAAGRLLAAVIIPAT